jgi:hypothetical protein
MVVISDNKYIKWNILHLVCINNLIATVKCLNLSSFHMSFLHVDISPFHTIKDKTGDPCRTPSLLRKDLLLFLTFEYK